MPIDLADSAPRHPIRRAWPSRHSEPSAASCGEDDPRSAQPWLSRSTYHTDIEWTNVVEKHHYHPNSFSTLVHRANRTRIRSLENDCTSGITSRPLRNP